MPRFIIERKLPGAGKLTQSELAAIARRSCDVIAQLGPHIQWVQSYVTDDAIYCTYLAPNEQLIREHARRGGFPADRVDRVQSIIDPTTADG